MSQDNFADIIPYGDLGIIALESSRAIGEKVDNYVSSWRNESRNDEESIHFTSYKKDSYLSTPFALDLVPVKPKVS